MRLGIRIGLVYIVLAGLFLGASILSHEALQAIAREAQTAAREDEAMFRRLGQLRHDFELAWKESRLSAATRRPTPTEAATKLRADVSRQLALIHGLSREQERPVASTLLASWNRIATAFDRIPARGTRLDRYFLEHIQPELDPFRRHIETLHTLRLRGYEDRVGRIRVRAEEARLQLVVLASLVVAAGIALYLVIRHRILRPLSLMIGATRKIASGDLSQRIDFAGDDEFGDLSADFNAMAVRLADAERMKMEFLSMVSHEMRTPLTAMSGYASLLIKGRHGPITEKQAASLNIIARETQRLQYLVDDLLEAARAEAGSFRIDRSRVDLGQELHELMKTFARQAEDKGIVLSYDVGGLPEAVVDERRISQALRNLVANAIKFTPAGGTVRVDGAVEGSDLHFRVSDTGPGIPSEQASRIFDRFYQTHPTQDGRAGGVGLGLAIVREIITAHQGRIDVESHLGIGTTFHVTIPWTRPPEAAPGGST